LLKIIFLLAFHSRITNLIHNALMRKPQKNNFQQVWLYNVYQSSLFSAVFLFENLVIVISLEIEN